MRGEQWDTDGVGARLLARTAGLVSRAKNGTCPFARSCCATSLLTLCQELAFPMARKDARTFAYFYAGPLNGH